jgi:transcription initiation factor TFIID subunit 2
LPYLYVNNGAWGPRSWFPCVDKDNVKCTWELEITVPVDVDEALGFKTQLNRGMVAIASGDLVDHLVHPINEKKKIFVYSISTPVAASSIILAVGPFESTGIRGWGRSNASQVDSSVPDLEEMDRPTEGRFSGGGRTFYLYGQRARVEQSTKFLHQALDFLEQYMGSYPFSSYKQVFVDDTYSIVSTGATMAILNTSLIIEKDNIDFIYDSRRNIVRALTSQWIDHYLGFASWADIWLSIGLNNFLTSLFLQKHLGNNEYRYRLKSDIKKVCGLDIGQFPLYPISEEGKDIQLEPKYLHIYFFDRENYFASQRHQLLHLKAPIVLYMFEKWLLKGLVQKTLNKFMVSAMSEELPNGISTAQFLKVARKVCAKAEVKSFSDLWIYGAGCPRFNIKFFFNKKKMVAEFKFVQECTNTNSGTRFYGPLTIRLIEPGGIYDQQILIQDIQKKYILAYNTKYKRLKKSINIRSGEIDGVIQDVVELIDVSDDEPDSETTLRVIYEWIRIDPEMDWLCDLTFDQPEIMAVTQLKNDRDVIAQYEGVRTLGKFPSALTTATLVSIIKDTNIFYRVRMDAVYALAQHGNHSAEMHGLNIIKKLYRDQFCRPMRDVRGSFFPKQNNFQIIQNYYVQKVIEF